MTSCIGCGLARERGLAITQRASGEDPQRVRAMLKLALSVFRREPA